MRTLSLVNCAYQALKLLHFHPEQKFEIHFYLFKMIWLISSLITFVMVPLNFFNEDVPSEILTQNVNLAASIVQVRRGI